MSMQVYANPTSSVITLDHHDPAETYRVPGVDGRILTTVTVFPDGYALAWTRRTLTGEKLFAPADLHPTMRAEEHFGRTSELTTTIYREVQRLIRAAGPTPGPAASRGQGVER
jgi:hypothetical protein